ncbi:MAG: PD-(D/E)XK motif protein, partial [Candidatus Micrarchaeaceae archaeon]
AGADHTAADAIATLLGKWRRFWGHSPIQILSRKEQIGLLAELWFLSRWLIPKVGLVDAVKGWRGPFGSRHDFERKHESIEVKATMCVEGLVHRVNGIDQLAPPENGALYLFSLKLREDANATHSLPQIICNCRDLCKDSSDALSHLENALAMLCYLDVHEPEYAKFKCRIVSEILFSVRDDFPRLTTSDIKSGIPSGVENIGYDIDLKVARHLQVADSPDVYFHI